MLVDPQELHALHTYYDPDGRDVFMYPAFFADARHDRAVLERVSRALGSLPGGAKWEFFTTPRLSLGRKTPLQALARGQVEEVLAAAAAFADA